MSPGSVHFGRHFGWLFKRRTQGLVAAAVACLLCAYWWGSLTGSAVINDASGNLKMALNLYHHGVMASELDRPQQPSMYREPLPILATAAMIAALDALRGEAAAAEYFQGERAEFLKRQNLLWLALLCVGAFLGARFLGISFYGSLAAALLAQYSFFFYSGMRDIGSDTLLSEVPAAAFMVLSSSWLVRSMRAGHSRTYAGLAGLAFGALALTKAFALYIFGVMVVILAVHAWLKRRSPGVIAQSPAALLALVACFSVVVAPWMLRNYLQFERFAITERGGLALYTRVLKNDLTSVEYRGTFYAWAPAPTRPSIGRVLGFSEQDLQRGGRLQRLNGDSSDFEKDDITAERSGRPDLAISFYYSGRAERVREQTRLAAEGHPNADTTADINLTRRALQMALEQWPQHLLVTIPMLWRGAIVAFPILVVALVYALVRRRYDLGIFVLPGLGTILFYALLTPSEPRYGAVALPLAIVSLLPVGSMLIGRGKLTVPR